MIGEVLQSIAEAEAKAAAILISAEEEVRKIEARNYSMLQHVRDEMGLKISRAVKTMEEGARNQTTAAAPADEPLPEQKIKQARDFIVDFVIGGAM